MKKNDFITKSKGVITTLLLVSLSVLGMSCTETETDEIKSPEIENVTITFDSQGGSEIASQTIESGKFAVEPDEPTKNDGSLFDAWYISITAQEKFDFESTAITVNTTLYARWITQYKVTYVYNNGVEAKTISVANNTVLEKPEDPTFDGFDFMGWFASGSSTPYDFAVPVTSNLTLTASWSEINPYTTVTFYQNFGDDSISQEVQILRDSAVSAEQADNIAPKGCVNMAWYTDKECTNEYDFSTTVSLPISLWGTWQMQDASGNLYGITKIGEQYWSTSNLKARKFADGSDIPFADCSDGTGILSADTWVTAWQSESPVCSGIYVDSSWEANDEANKRTEKLGLIYNWYAASSDKNLCPEGWHVPGKVEFATLTSAIIYPYAHKLATDEQGAWVATSDNQQWVKEGVAAYDATLNNETGFSFYAVPCRMDNGWFTWDNNFALRNEGILWCSDGEYREEQMKHFGNSFKLNAHEEWVNTPDPREAGWGFGIRCVRDSQ